MKLRWLWLNEPSIPRKSFRQTRHKEDRSSQSVAVSAAQLAFFVAAIQPDGALYHHRTLNLWAVATDYPLKLQKHLSKATGVSAAGRLI
jgi:hypothetical protein